MRAKDLKQAIKLCLKGNQNLCIAGAPAIGKTEITEQVAAEVCAEKGGAFMVLHPVCDDPSDWKGLGFPNDTRTSATFLPYGNLLSMINADKPLIVIIDDVGQAPFSVQAAIMQAVRERTVNGKKISDNVSFVLCTNRRGDKAGVQGIIEPLKSRCVIVNLDVSDDDWRVWANDKSLPPELIAFSKIRPNLLHDFKPTSDISNSASPRGWGEVGRLMLSGITKNIEYELFAGCNGEQFATEFCAFLKNYREMANPQDYIQDPDKELPTSEEMLYSLSAALSYIATSKNVDKVFRIAMRLDAEYSTFMVFSMIQRDKKLSQHSGMAAWAKKYAAYLI